MKLIFALLPFITLSCADAPNKNNAKYNQSDFIIRLKKKSNVVTNIQSIIDLLHEEKYIEVIDIVDNELAIRKDSISFLYYCRGIASYNLNDNNNAKQAFILALENRLPDDEIYGWLGNAYQQLNELDSAVKYYKIGIDKIGQAPHLLNNLGIVYITQKRFEKAIVIYQDIIKQDSLNIDYCFNQTRVYYEMQDYKKGFTLVQKYKMLYSNDCRFYNLEAQIYVQQKMFTEARKSWEKSLQLKPNDNIAADNLKKFDLIKAYHSAK